MPAKLAQRDDENSAVADGLTPGRLRIVTTLDGVGSPRLQISDFLGSPACQPGWHNKSMKMGSGWSRVAVQTKEDGRSVTGTEESPIGSLTWTC
jgi:hypothetical protein